MLAKPRLSGWAAFLEALAQIHRLVVFFITVIFTFYEVFYCSCDVNEVTLLSYSVIFVLNKMIVHFLNQRWLERFTGLKMDVSSDTQLHTSLKCVPVCSGSTQSILPYAYFILAQLFMTFMTLLFIRCPFWSTDQAWEWRWYLTPQWLGIKPWLWRWWYTAIFFMIRFYFFSSIWL